jgi:hypothetical protein
MMLDRLADFEIERFEEEFADQNWYKGKQTKEIEAMEKARKRGKLSEWTTTCYTCSVHRTDSRSHHQRPEEDIRGRQGVCPQASIETLTQGSIASCE